MGKRMLAVPLLVILAIGAACSGGSFELNQAEAAETVLSEISFEDTLLPMPEQQAGNYYPRLTDVSDGYVIYLSSTGLTTEEFAVVKAREGSTAEDVRALLEKRVEDQRFRYESYLPEQVWKLDGAVIETKGGYAVMIICGDPDRAAEVVGGLLK